MCTQKHHGRGRFLRRHRSVSRLADDAGYSLLELLIATSLSLLVLGAFVALFALSQKDSANVTTRAESVQTAETGLREMDQVVRQAYAIEFPVSGATGCTETAGVEPCSEIDVLARLSGVDYEVRYDCSVVSSTIAADHACWRYECSVSASTGAGSTCTSAGSSSGGTLLASNLVIDDITNSLTANTVFSFCYANTTTVNTSPCANGATRPTSATVTIDTPASGTAPAASGGDTSSVVLSDAVYMPNLDFNQ
jgi:Tfp pilus assembly protein PilX